MSAVRRGAVVYALLLVLAAAVPTAAAAQRPDAGDGYRIGISVGGISTVGLTLELFRDARSIDLTLGTFSFRDVALSAVVKQYFRDSDLRPFVGAGLWLMIAAPPDEERTGVALVARVPLGVDWNLSGDHSIGAEVTINRALAIRRPDPADERPLNGRLVPLPGFYYRWAP